MADLSITATQVLFDRVNPFFNRPAGVALTAGQVVYLDVDRAWQLALCDGTIQEAFATGIVIGSANAGQPCLVAHGGGMILGATASPVEGIFYVLSDTPGGIMPCTDLTTSTWFATLVGVGTEDNGIYVTIMPTSQQVP